MPDTKLAISYQDIEDAAEILRGVAHRTPVVASTPMQTSARAEVFLKCEHFQRAGAFKFRGAYNAISRLDTEQKRKGVIAYSSGNHAQAVALASQILDVPATIVMPYDAPAVKLEATREYGANVILYHRGTESREAIAERLMVEYGLVLIPPFNHPYVIAGQGTAAKELIEETGPLDYLFVPVGGGGLIAGSAISVARLSPGCKVIGVEPEAGNDAQQSFRNGKIITIPIPTTIADGAQTQAIGELTLHIMQKLVHDIVTVTDDQLRAQMKFFSERMKIIVEPTGCLGAAAVANRVVNVTGKRVGVILSGGNMDLNY